MKEGYQRGIQPKIAESELRKESLYGDIAVQRYIDQESNTEILQIKINPRMIEWQETPLGRLRIDPLELQESRDGNMTRILRLHFDKQSELRQKGNGSQSFKSQQFRELVVSDSGVAWQQLRKMDMLNKQKPSVILRPKWLCVVLDKPQQGYSLEEAYAKVPSFQDGM